MTTSWTGSKATFVSETGDHGSVPFSELAMHVGIAGTTCTQYALFGDTWAHVRANDLIVDGLYSEVLPWEVRRKHNLG